MPSKTFRGAAVTSTTRAQVTAQVTADFPNNVVNIPSGQGGTLVAIEVLSAGTLETGVFGAGGKIELENDARPDWSPVKLYTNFPQELTATSGGFVYQKPEFIPMNLPLPAGSNIKFYFTPYDDQSQQLEITLIWTIGTFNGKIRHYDTAIGTAVTATTIASNNATITIPANLGGQLLYFRAAAIKAAAVVVGTDPNFAGGTVAARNDSAGNNWLTEFSTGMPSGLVAGAYLVEQITFTPPHALNLPGNSVARFDYTPYNDASQQLIITIAWE